MEYINTPGHQYLLFHFLSELKGDSWQVTRIVKTDELGRPDERLREQMRKLELTQKGEEIFTHIPSFSVI